MAYGGANRRSYQFNPHLTKEETITNILVKALTVFPSPDFALCLHLLPPNTLLSTTVDPLSDAIRKLAALNELLESAAYREFWATLDGDDLYADLVADCQGFEDLVRVRIAMTTASIAREIAKDVLMAWLNLHGDEFAAFVEKCSWRIEGDVVKIPINKENEAKTTVYRESVSFSREPPSSVLLLPMCFVGRAVTDGKQSSSPLFGERTSRLRERCGPGRGTVYSECLCGAYASCCCCCMVAYWLSGQAGLEFAESLGWKNVSLVSVGGSAIGRRRRHP